MDCFGSRPDALEGVAGLPKEAFHITSTGCLCCSSNKAPLKKRERDCRGVLPVPRCPRNPSSRWIECAFVGETAKVPLSGGPSARPAHVALSTGTHIENDARLANKSRARAYFKRMLVTVLNPQTVCWLLVESGGRRVPALPWALGDALLHVARRAPADGSLARAALPRTTAAAEAAAHHAMRRLVELGAVSPAGSGWYAGFEPVADRRHQLDQLRGCLSGADRRVMREAAQRLVAMATIWSKKPVTSLPRGAATI